MNMKKRGFVFMCLLCLFLIGGALSQDAPGLQKKDGSEQGADQQEDGRPQLTVWLDEESDYEIRDRIYIYDYVRKSPYVTGDADYFLDIKWNLVEKNYLSPAQYRQELEEALAKGEGPDIIYMDTYNGLDPEALAGSGALAELGDLTSRAKTFTYVPGALEAGQQDGKTYIMPLYMECPIVFGLSEELEEAGIRTDGSYDSFGAFLDALLLAQEQTGKLVFENDAAIDWLERYYLPEDQAEAGALTEKLEQLRACCGEDETNFGAYKGLAEGACLLGGCGVYDYKGLARNISLFQEEAVMFNIPDSTGTVRGIITHAAAVNAASKNVEEAKAALTMFQTNKTDWVPDIPVLDDYIDGILAGQAAWEQDAQGMRALYDDRSRLPEKTERNFINCTKKAVERMTFASRYGADVSGEGEEVKEETGQEKKVVSISYGAQGDDPDYPITRWLEHVAAAYEEEHEDVCIQFLRSNWFFEYHDSGVAPDAWVKGNILTEEYAGILADLSPLIQSADPVWDPLTDVCKGGIVYDGEVLGLPLWAEEYGIWCSRKKLEQAGLPADWKPEGAKELTDGFEKLKQAAGTEDAAVVMANDYYLYQTLSLFLSDVQEGLLEQKEDGDWRCSKEGWISFLDCLRDWKERALVTDGRRLMDSQVSLELSEGEISAWMGSSSLSGWFDGSYGRRLKKKQQEDIFFIPLSPAAHITMFCVSDTSEHAEEIVSFWKEAVKSPDYAQAVRDISYIPLTGLSDTVSRVVPTDNGGALDWLWEDLWFTDTPVEELAEEYQWYDWM